MKTKIAYTQIIISRNPPKTWKERIEDEIVNRPVDNYLFDRIDNMIIEIEREKAAFQGRLLEDEWEALWLLRSYDEQAKEIAKRTSASIFNRRESHQVIHEPRKLSMAEREAIHERQGK